MSDSMLPSKHELAIDSPRTPELGFDDAAARAGVRADSWFRRRMLALLGSLRGCEITMVEPGQNNERQERDHY